MDFTNALANNEKDFQDEDFYHDEEDSVDKCELFKHNVYEGNEISSMEEDISSLEKFNEEGITLNVIPSFRFIEETLDIEMVADTENTIFSPVITGHSKSYACPVCSKIYKAELHYMKHISKCDKYISTAKFSKLIELTILDLKA